MTYSKAILKKLIQNWMKAAAGNAKDKQIKCNQAWYDAQVQCQILKIDFSAVEKFVEGKRSKFKLEQLD